jgi:hypothetical protein
MACIESSKRTEEVKLRLTERELLDISRVAAVEERAVAEVIVRMLRLSMYGSLACRAAALEGVPEGLSGSGRACR